MDPSLESGIPPALLTALVAAMLTGCADTGSGRTACELVTPADIGRVIPEVTATKAYDSGDELASRCRIYGADTYFTVSLLRDAGDEEFERLRGEAGRDSVGVRRLEGLGDEAFGHLGREGDVVTARRGSAIVTVSVPGGSKTDSGDVRRLAEIAVDRL